MDGRRQESQHHGPDSITTAVHGTETALRMTEAAVNFLSSLSAEERKRIYFPVQSEERINWHYVPRPRNGIPLRELSGGQRKLAHVLIAGGLSGRGYAKAMTIMSLEPVLKQIEGSAGRFERDADLYYLTFFGIPSEKDPWGWRVEGHHISINFLVVNRTRVAWTPNFLGAHPAEVPHGFPLAGLRVLGNEEDLGRSLLSSLNHLQRKTAIFDPNAPPDILTGAEAHVGLERPLGLAASDMTEPQQEILIRLVSEYLDRVPEDLADAQMERIEMEGKKHIHFAWAGSGEMRQPHYYRVHGPTFLIEYDNTQNEANHIHSVWRDLRNDWGEDSLRQHYERSHRHE